MARLACRTFLYWLLWFEIEPIHFTKDFEIENKSLNGILQWSCVCRGPNWTLQFSILHRSWHYAKGVLFGILHIAMILLWLFSTSKNQWLLFKNNKCNKLHRLSFFPHLYASGLIFLAIMFYFVLSLLQRFCP